jgi:hypothetical protein
MSSKKIQRERSDDNISRKKSRRIPKGKGDYFVSTGLMRQNSSIVNESDSESARDSSTTSKSNNQAREKKSKKRNDSLASRTKSASNEADIHEEDLSSDDDGSRAFKKKDDPLEYFEKSTEDDKYICKVCKNDGKPPKFIKMAGSNDTGLRKHLGGVHKMDKFLYASQKKQLKNHQKQQQPQVDEIEPLQQGEQSTKADLSLTKERITELNEAVMNCIIQDGRSFNDFRKRGMMQFFAVSVISDQLEHTENTRSL